MTLEDLDKEQNEELELTIDSAVKAERQRIVKLIEEVLPYGHDAVLEVLKTIN